MLSKHRLSTTSSESRKHGTPTKNSKLLPWFYQVVPDGSGDAYLSLADHAKHLWRREAIETVGLVLLDSVERFRGWWADSGGAGSQKRDFLGEAMKGLHLIVASEALPVAFDDHQMSRKAVGASNLHQKMGNSNKRRRAGKRIKGKSCP